MCSHRFRSAQLSNIIDITCGISKLEELQLFDYHYLLLKMYFSPPCLHPASTDVDGNGFICASELGDLFREVGCPLPGYQIRELLQKLDRDKDSRINLDEFTAVGNTN